MSNITAGLPKLNEGIKEIPFWVTVITPAICVFATLLSGACAERKQGYAMTEKSKKRFENPDNIPAKQEKTAGPALHFSIQGLQHSNIQAALWPNDTIEHCIDFLPHYFLLAKKLYFANA
jgi:hypothetical protein